MQNTFQSKSLYYQLVEILKQRIENSMVKNWKKWATFIDNMEKEPVLRN